MMKPQLKSERKCEMKLVGIFATTCLVPLLAGIFPDSQMAKNLVCKRSKATMALKQSLRKQFVLQFLEKLDVRKIFL